MADSLNILRSNFGKTEHMDALLFDKARIGPFAVAVKKVLYYLVAVVQDHLKNLQCDKLWDSVAGFEPSSLAETVELKRP